MMGAALLVGQRLGVYEVQARIGAGGMGEVYRARDTRLGRDVAIKILPLHFADDPERLTRFAREARILASLNHPNIAAIYGVEDRDGQPPALILELVDGETLADRLANGAIRVDTAVAWARQIAAALDAAHERGIVHRDLKPANIKIAPDDAVKVLDFGIAKAIVPDDDSATTIVRDDTRAGTVMGTAAYMSPEQARGLAVDKRTDIWAFGCVLFEMLSGHPAFAGSTASDIIAAVIERPPQWSLLPPAVPAHLHRLLQRCLEKDLRLRLRDIGDANRELESPIDKPTTSTSSRKLLWIAMATMAAAIVALGIMLLRPQAQPDEFRLEISRPATNSAQVAFSPDGRALAIAPRLDARERLVVRRLDAVDARALPGTEGAIFPFWSPDGKSLGFFADRKLKRIDLAGEAVQIIADAPIGRGGAWASDDSILFAPNTTSPIYRVAATGGTPSAITTIGEGQTDHRAPVILPDGNNFLFYARGMAQGRGVYVARIDGSNPRRLLDAAAASVFAPSGHLLFPREGHLFAQRFDASTLTLSGEPFSVADDVAVNIGVSLATLAASSSGAVAFATASPNRIQWAWFDRSGTRVGVVGSPDPSPITNPALSPDGQTLAFARLNGGNWDIWLMEMARGVMTRLTTEQALDFVPVWTPDNARVIYQSNRGEIPDLYMRSLTGTDELLLKSAASKTPTDVSSDGRLLLFTQSTPATSQDIWVMPLDRALPPRALLETTSSEGGAQFSPDNRWIAFSSNETGQSEIYVQPFPGPGPRRRISTTGGNLVRWSHHGSELFYVAADGKMISAPISMSASGQLAVGTPKALFTAGIDPAGFGNRAAYDVSVDDQRFLMPVLVDPAVASSVVVILNWHPQR